MQTLSQQICLGPRNTAFPASSQVQSLPSRNPGAGPEATLGESKGHKRSWHTMAWGPNVACHLYNL